MGLRGGTRRAVPDPETELPAFLVEVLEEIDRILARVPDQDGSSLAEEEVVGVPEDQGGKWS